MKRSCFHCLLFFLLGVVAFAQHPADPPEMNRLKDLFTKGHIDGRIRNYFMATVNEGELSDYLASAVGGTMRYESPEYFGFHFGAAGIFTYKVFTSDLNDPDPITGGISRWEHELFDILDTDNFNDLDRLEELYLQYRFSRGHVTYGKLEIEDTPLLNRSDERMKPFAFKGVWIHYRPGKNQVMRLAWLDRISARSTVEWFDFNEGIGLTDNGYQPDGHPAEYHEHQESSGVALLGYEREFRDLDLRFHHWYIHHIGHTGWLELNYHLKDWELGLQYALQAPDRFQRGLEYEQRYLQPGEHGQVLSGRLCWKPLSWEFRAAYTHAFSSGRFLFPRELGRDQFFTSIPRSRLEGFGNVDVLTLSGDYRFSTDGLSAGVAFTSLFGAKVDGFEFNKYNLDAYRQWNAHLAYNFHGFLDGLGIELLYIHKENMHDTRPEVIFNNSNFHQFNLVTNFTF